MPLWLAEMAAIVLCAGAATGWVICFAGARSERSEAFEDELRSW